MSSFSALPVVLFFALFFSSILLTAGHYSGKVTPAFKGKVTPSNRGPSDGLIGLKEDRPSYVAPPRPWQQIAQRMERRISERQAPGLHFEFAGGIPAKHQKAIRFAGEILSTLIQFNTAIRVSVVVETVEEGVLAYAGCPILGSGGVYLPLPVVVDSGYFYEEPPIESGINSLAFDDLYTGLDGKPGPGQYDLVSIMVHELCHGLGIFSWVSGETPVYDLEGTYILDFGLEESGTGFALTDVMDNEAALLDWSTSEDIYHVGSFLEGETVKIYAPSEWAPGSSVSHLDEYYFPEGDLNSLMTPGIALREAIHHPGGYVLKMFEEMGYTIRDCAAYTSCGKCAENGCTWCFLNPTANATLEELLETSEGVCGDPGAKPFFNYECSSGVTTQQCATEAPSDSSSSTVDDSRDTSSSEDGAEDGDGGSAAALDAFIPSLFCCERAGAFLCVCFSTTGIFFF